MYDPDKVSLGKQARTLDSRTLHLENYVNVPALPPLPDVVDWTKKISKWTMMGNDVYGDCVVAGCGHQIQTWTANAARERLLSDKVIIKTYLDRTDGEDSGLNLLAFLKWWRKNSIAGHPIDCFVAVDPKNWLMVRYAVYLFGGLLVGLGLPASAKGQNVWDVPYGGVQGEGEPWTWGGHLTQCPYVSTDQVKLTTWGEEQPATRSFIAYYCDEAYVALSLDWFTGAHKTPHGFGWKDLKADMGRITR